MRTDELTAEGDIRAAYRWILGREADEGGLRAYVAELESGQLNKDDLRSVFLNSEEFKLAQGLARAVAGIGHGLSAVVDPHDPEFGRFIAEQHHWELHIVAAIRANLTRGDTFVDIGANLGVMSFNAAQVVGSTGKVIAFEPNPKNVANYRRGIVVNGFENVLLYPFAVSDRFRTITTSDASNAKVVADANPLTNNDVVQAVPADRFLEGENRIDFVKIDIEGYELPALKGMDATLRRHRPKVLMEFNPLCLSAFGEGAAVELAEHVFSMADDVRIVEHDGSFTPVNSATHLMDLWADRDEQMTAAGRLPKGWVHFDLLFRAYADGPGTPT